MTRHPLIARKIAIATAVAYAGAALALDPTHVPTPNPKAAGLVSVTKLAPELAQVVAAAGAMPLENPVGLFGFYGYSLDGPLMAAAGAVQSPSHSVEATKTEPDKNTYLILKGQHGADAGYDYGTHFLYQGHENSSAGRGYVTRINLDADAAHRVTLLASADRNGNPLPLIDGSTWYPWSKHLLFTSESGTSGGVWQATPDYPSTVDDLSGALGRGGYEGIQADSDGNLWIIEDVGGANGTVNTHAKQSNSFVYRFIPKDRSDLTKGGRLQALQVASKRQAGPISFHAGQADADIKSNDVLDLYTYGVVFDTRWITLHDTATIGFTPFSANALAKAAGATPFKRPENGLFRPGSKFREFYFDTTGDTNALTEAGSDYGGFGGIFRLVQAAPSADVGTLSLFYKGDVAHTGLDNVAFWDANRIVFVEDGGDGLHAQRNALDSAYLFDLRLDYAKAANQPVRILAQGRDASATFDQPLTDGRPGNGFQNDGDNEITGFHISDGDTSIGGILGAKTPRPFKSGWRMFYTQQHGDNITYEIVADPAAGDDDEGDDD